MCQGLAPWYVLFHEVPQNNTAICEHPPFSMYNPHRCRRSQQSESRLHMPRPVKGNYDGAVVSGFFIAPTRNRPCVGVNTTGMGDK